MKLKDHPYDYISRDNFEKIKSSIQMGITLNKSPVECAQLMSESTGLDMKITMAIVQAELIDTMKELEKKGNE